MLIGIAGGTGSGKTTVAQQVAAGLPEGMGAIIEYDSYYKDHSGIPLEERALLNYDHPDALDTEYLLQQLTELRNGQPIEVPIYDYTKHVRKRETRHVEPTAVIILEGILVLVDERIRSLLDWKIFVDTDADIRVIRRIRRDMNDRGRTFEAVREQYYRTVRPMHLTYVEPSKQWADIIIPEGGRNTVALDLIVGKLLHVLSTDGH